MDTFSVNFCRANLKLQHLGLDLMEQIEKLSRVSVSDGLFTRMINLPLSSLQQIKQTKPLAVSLKAVFVARMALL